MFFRADVLFGMIHLVCCYVIKLILAIHSLLGGLTLLTSVSNITVFVYLVEQKNRKVVAF